MARGKQWVRDANAAAAKRQKTIDEASKEEDEVLVVDAVTGTEAPPPLERTGAEDGLAEEEEIEEPTAEQIAAHKFAIEQNFLHAMCSNSPEDMSRFRVRTVGDMMFFMAFQISKCLVPHHNARYAMRGDSTEIKAMDTDLQHIRIMQESIFAFHFASGKRNDLFEARLVPYMLGILELFWQAMAIKLNGGKYEVCACVCFGAMCACVCLGATCACVCLWRDVRWSLLSADARRPCGSQAPREVDPVEDLREAESLVRDIVLVRVLKSDLTGLNKHLRSQK
jgi:hypothetical protein